MITKAGDRFKLAAGWMIERCGLKGSRVGKAAVHDGQSLMLINLGGATGAEILALSRLVEDAVRGMFGVELEREVKVIAHVGFPEGIFGGRAPNRR